MPTTTTSVNSTRARAAQIAPVPALVYTLAEAGQAMHVSVAIVRALISRGHLPCVKLGPRKTLIRRKSLEQLLETAERSGGIFPDSAEDMGLSNLMISESKV